MYKILAVEDSPAILNLIRMSLEDAGGISVSVRKTAYRPPTCWRNGSLTWCSWT